MFGVLQGNLSGGVAFEGLLDLYPSAAVAYSLRLLKSDYAGSSIRVRRSSDNAEQDIGFVGNILDQTALTDFVGANDGFVVTWYDQSGNGNNVTQTTASSQPTVVVSGVLVTEGGKPTCKFDTTDFMNFNSSFTPETSIIVNKLIASSTVNYVFWKQSSPNKGYFLSGSFIGDNVGVFDGSVKGAFANDGLFHLDFFDYNGTNFQISENGSAYTSLSAGSNFSVEQLGRGASNFTANSNVSEVIAWGLTQNSNKSGIETNINDFYTIY